MAESSNSSANAGSQTSGSGAQNAAATSGNDGFGSGFSGLSFSDGQFSVNSNGNFSGGDTQSGPIGIAQGAWGNRGLPGEGTNSMVPAGTPLGTNFETPTMTVDEVYGKSNQARVESQGDYAALSNEKSNVETSTFGKQDAISVTPLSVTENKAEADNAAIQSIEGLTFEQKDKQSQDVLDSRKSRDEAEAEDKSNQMRNQILALNENKVTDEDADSFFKIGESRQEKAFNEEDGKRTTELKQQEQQLNRVNQEVNKQRNNVEKAQVAVDEAQAKVEAARNEHIQVNNKMANIQEALVDAEKRGDTAAYEKATNELYSVAEEYGIDYDSLRGDAEKSVEGPKMLANEISVICNRKTSDAQDALTEANESLTYSKNSYEDISNQQKNLQAQYNKNKKGYDSWRTDAWAKVTNSPDYSLDSFINELKTSDDPTANEAGEKLGNIQADIDTINDFAEKNGFDFNKADPADVNTFVTTFEALSKDYEDAANGDYSKTNFSKQYATEVMNVLDRTVSLPDGRTMTTAQYITEAVVQSPEIIPAMYEAKAKNYAENNHPVLAAITELKANMAQNWLGAKFTFADNQFRNTFNQIAKTNFRATYIACNNILGDTTGKYSEADKAEARKNIAQANSLMVASTTLKASTGFFSGIGDSYKDGYFGVTDPSKLSDYQTTLSNIKSFVQITLGLGVTPGANQGWQTLYYMNEAVVGKIPVIGSDSDEDGFALCQEYGNNPAANMILGITEAITGAAFMIMPATRLLGANMIQNAIPAVYDGLFGLKNDAKKSQKYTNQVLSYFKDVQDIAAKSGNEEAVRSLAGAISQIENFELQSDEVNDLDKWLEGSGSNTADNGKFNQSLSYDEWLRLIEADPTMQDYAKKLIAEKR